MQPKTPKHLDDIHDAATFICQATDGKTVGDYRGDRLLRQAVERNFESSARQSNDWRSMIRRWLGSLVATLKSSASAMSSSMATT